MRHYDRQFRERTVRRFCDVQESVFYTTPREYARELGIPPCMLSRWLKADGVKVEKMTSRGDR